jgi:hypothetical protein
MGAEPVSLERLRKAIRGADPAIARGEAFALLAAGPFQKREELLGQSLHDPGEPATSRRAAAIALGRIATAEAEQTLLAGLKGTEPPVQADIMRSLGRIGGRTALKAIEALDVPPPARPAAGFAMGLIAHRLGLDGHDLAPPSEKQLLEVPEESRKIDASPLEPERAAKVLADLRLQPYGIDYDPETLVRLQCGPRVNVVCPSLEVMKPGGIARLTERKALAGVAAYESPETHDYSVSYLLLTAPEGSSGGVHIHALRCSGRGALAGSGNVEGDRLIFRLRSLERPGGFRVELSGLLTEERLRFRVAKVSHDQLPSLLPTRTPGVPAPVE